MFCSPMLHTYPQCFPRCVKWYEGSNFLIFHVVIDFNGNRIEKYGWVFFLKNGLICHSNVKIKIAHHQIRNWKINCIDFLNDFFPFFPISHLNCQTFTWIFWPIACRIYLWSKVIRLYLWDPPNRDASDCVLGLFGKLSRKMGASAWFHGVWTCGAKVFEYWMIFSLN